MCEQLLLYPELELLETVCGDSVLSQQLSPTKELTVDGFQVTDDHTQIASINRQLLV